MISTGQLQPGVIHDVPFIPRQRRRNKEQAQQAESLSEASQQQTFNDEEVLKIMPLGAGCEVGRSCIYIECKGRKILLDCGLHPAREGIQALPYFDRIVPEDLDMLLLTHFHVDHCAGMPYFLEKTGFKGKVFATHPTKSIYNYITQDFVKVSNISSDEQIFGTQDVAKSLKKIHTLNYHQESEHNGIKFTAYRAGHVLGAALFLIEIDGVKILYTGDYSREEDRHLKPAEIPQNTEVDVLIVESTYGVEKHEPRENRETKFKQVVHDIVRRGGKCLMPCFALGRAQELLLILNEYWKENPELQNVPIVYSGSLAQKSLEVLKTHRNMMSDELRIELERGKNPFRFEQKSEADIKDPQSGPLVVMAGPGMLQSGLSRDLFLEWAPEKKNGIIFTGYSVEGTLAKEVMNSNKLISVGDTQILCEMSVDTISFSAHADFLHTRDYIEQVLPPNIVLVHGDQQQMKRLKQELNAAYREKIAIFNPKNCQMLKMNLVCQKSAKVFGRLAQSIQRAAALEPKPLADRALMNGLSNGLSNGHALQKEEEKLEEDDNFVEVSVDGIFVKHDFEHFILNEDEVEKFTQNRLTFSTMKQTLMVPFPYDIQVLVFFLSSHFPRVEVQQGEDEVQATIKEASQPPSSDQPVHAHYDLLIRVGGTVPEMTGDGSLSDTIEIKYFYRSQKLQLDWLTSPRNDMLADSLCLLVMQINEHTTPELVKMLDITKEKRRDQEFQLHLQMALEAHFPAVEPSGPTTLRISLVDNKEAYVELDVAEAAVKRTVCSGDAEMADITSAQTSETRALQQIKEEAETIIRMAKKAQQPAVTGGCCH